MKNVLNNQVEKFTFNFDRKVTVWERTVFEIDATSEEEAKKKIVELINNNVIDKDTFLDDINEVEYINDFILDDTKEYITVEENQGNFVCEVNDQDFKWTLQID
jgi:hypothetical protein